MTSTCWNGNSRRVGVLSKSALRGWGVLIFSGTTQYEYAVFFWTQSCIIIVEKVNKKQSWHSLQDQGSAAISLAKPLHWHIYWLIQMESVRIWIYMNVLNYVGRKCYRYTFTKRRGRFYILFFCEILKGSATDYSQWSPTLTTYPLSSQLRLTCSHNSLLCWVYSLQLQALLAPGLLSTKDCFVC